MEYEFLNSSIERENIILPNSDKINQFLLKNNRDEIVKAIDFFATEEKFLYVYGFMGSGKRQFMNYIQEFLDDDVIILEYFCKEATVCDDILLDFTRKIEANAISKAVNLNTKITTMDVKFKQMVSSIKKPFVIILHSYDDILKENRALTGKMLSGILAEANVKLVVSTRAMDPVLIEDVEEDRKILLKAFTEEIFKEYLESANIEASDRQIEDFYKHTRGYYYYVALSLKIMQAMKINLGEFLQKLSQSQMSFDSFLGATYINLVPDAIRNFFWFLRTVRHGLTLNALAVIDVYDEFAIQYLKTNLMIFQADETLYVQDYFLQNIDISIPQKTQIKLHKYIVGIYEKQLKEPLIKRAILISRQAMRAEIEYHNQQVHDIENAKPKEEVKVQTTVAPSQSEVKKGGVWDYINDADKLFVDKKYTEAIELLQGLISEQEAPELTAIIEIRSRLAKLYKEISEYKMASHYYELLETYYKQHNEFLNLNYLYYDMADLYNKMYKNDRAVETIKKVVYSVDTPQYLMVNACTLLGNIYSDMEKPEEALTYYNKALESMDDNVEEEVLAELYFKFALAHDDNGDMDLAYEYYNKCIALNNNNPYRALAYSNLASCYMDNENYSDAKVCFTKAYNMEKANNNYDGIYYVSSKLAKIYKTIQSPSAMMFLLEAKKCAEFLNEDFYIMEAALELGDYYYNISDSTKLCLQEYFIALKSAEKIGIDVDTGKIISRIEDMKLRMSEEDFAEVESKYGR